MPIVLTPAQATAQWESYCDPSKGCHTVCCHVAGSPCEHLEWVDAARTVGRCAIYATRFGEHQTVAGQTFRCAPAAEWIQHVNPPDTCGYAKVVRIHGVVTARGKAHAAPPSVPVIRGMR